MNTLEYISKIAPIIQPIAEDYNILASLILGVSLVETDNGEKEDMINNNHIFFSKENSYSESIESDIKKWCEKIKTERTKKNKIRYENLFGITDYKKASIILQRSGYMINPQILIDTITVNELYKFDKETKVDPNHIYYIRTHWNDTRSQILETEELSKANEFASKNKNYKVYNENGELITDPWSYQVDSAYRVKKEWSDSDTILTTKSIEKAKNCSIQFVDYKVFDSEGNIIYNYWNELPNESKEASLKDAPTPYKGKKVILKDIPLYKSPLDKRASRLINGTYYFFNDIIINGKCRITAIKDDENPTHCIGLIDLNDIN